MAKKLDIILENAHRAEDDALVCLEVLLRGLLKATKKDIEGSFLFNLDDFKKIENFELKEHLKPLQEKIENQEIIRIKYQGGSKKNLFRPIRPLSFLPLPSGHVLYAHCLESNLFKFYQLNKISECLPPNEEDLKKYKNGKDI